MKSIYSEISKIELLYIVFVLTLFIAVLLLGQSDIIALFAKIFLGILGGITIIYFSLKKSLYGLFGLLFLFYFIPYSSPDYLTRIGEVSRFSLFSRFASTICTWDILIFLFAGLVIIKKLIKGRLEFVGIKHKEIRIYIYIMIFAFLNGLMHIKGNYLSFGPTEFIRPVIVFLPFFYMIFMFLITVNVIESKKDLDKTYDYIWLLTIILIFYSIYRLIGIYTGKFDALMMFGLPMILYDQVVFLFYPIFLYASLHFLKVDSGKKNLFVTFILFLIILSSTRRLNYLILAGGFIITLFLVNKVKKIGFGVFVKILFSIIVILCVIFSLFFIFLPDFTSGVYDSMRSIYFVSEYGMSHGGNIRKTEVENMFLNMNKRAYSYFIGYGLGTRYEAIKDVSFGRLDHGKKEIEKGSNWWPQFHLPYISSIYLFGFFGFFIMIFIVLLFVKRSINYIRKMEDNKYYQAQMIAIVSYLLLTVFFPSGSANPTSMIFGGILLGLHYSTNKYCLN
ncbi:hypothetical protein ACFL40_01300 [candidate division KSB1 bacterium]